ncbi:MAG TPA: 4a-hydroxytetrahydrobiopterin dehydratase [Acidimicrobiia bacterium]|nr:4a-hydroxytetrahydrobiopterin dehydratase [Acidimicrobiia bacterium]
MALATADEIEDLLREEPDWRRDGDALVAEFRFKDFNQAMGFLIRVALAAEKADHHPDIDLRWNKVRLSLSTHSEGGITPKDLTLAAALSGFMAT